jgi:alpha-1,2-mannosyltransferase
MAGRPGAPRADRDSGIAEPADPIRWLWRLLAVGVVAWAGLLYLVGNGDAGLDLDVYLRALVDASNGADIYAATLDEGRLPFTYPPSALIVLWPLGILPPGIAESAWLAISSGCIAFGVLATLRALGRSASDAQASRLLVWVLATWVVWFGLVLGQVGAVLLALCVADLLLLRGSRASGLLIGVATAIKITPALFIVWLLVSGQRRAAATATAAALALTAIAWLWLPEQSVAYWLQGVFSDTSRNIAVSATANQSLTAWVYRLTGAQVPWLSLFLGIAVSMAGLVAALVCHRRGAAVTALAVVGVATAATPAIGWSHQWVWFPLLIIAAWIEVGTRSVKFAAVIAAGVVTFPLGVLPRFIEPDDWLLARVASGAYVMSAVVLIGLVIGVLIRASGRLTPDVHHDTAA